MDECTCRRRFAHGPGVSTHLSILTAGMTNCHYLFPSSAQSRPYDPIYTSSLKPNNIHLHTVYTSPGLTLVSVTPFWAVALKMVRYQKDDPADITAILRNGTRLNGVQWTPEVLERWLLTECWAMGYASYPSWLIHDMREKIGHAVRQLNAPPPQDQALSRQPSMEPIPSQHTMAPAHQQLVTRHPSMDVGLPHPSRHSIPPPRSGTPPPTHPVIPSRTPMHSMPPVRHHHSLELLHPTQNHHARSISRHQSLPHFDSSMPMPQPQPFQHISVNPRQSLSIPPQHSSIPVPSQQHTSLPGSQVQHHHQSSQASRPHMPLVMPSQHVSPSQHHASSAQHVSPPRQHHPQVSHHASASQHLTSLQHHPLAPVVPPGALSSTTLVIPTAQLRGMNVSSPSHTRISNPPGHAGISVLQHGDQFQRHGGMLNWPSHGIMVGN